MEWKWNPTSSALRCQSGRGVRASRFTRSARRGAAGGAEAPAAHAGRPAAAHARAADRAAARGAAGPRRAAAARAIAVGGPVEVPGRRMARVGGGRAVRGLVAPVGEAVLARLVDVAPRVVLAAAGQGGDADQ